jgi:hypothetical protein
LTHKNFPWVLTGTNLKREVPVRVMLALFGFFTQQIVPFTYGTCAYIEEIDAER